MCRLLQKLQIACLLICPHHGIGQHQQRLHTDSFPCTIMMQTWEEAQREVDREKGIRTFKLAKVGDARGLLAAHALQYQSKAVSTHHT